jgi:hypothetical protein
VKDPGLELGFNPVLDRIRYLAENGLTSLMVLHDFLSKCLTPLQDRPHPAWMYTGVNDIMQQDRRPGSSLDEDLLPVVASARPPARRDRPALEREVVSRSDSLLRREGWEDAATE